MSASSPLVEQLHTAVAPHLASTTAAGHPSKGAAKTIKKLAKLLSKQERAAHKAVNSPKRTRKTLAGELMTSLQGLIKPLHGLENNVSKLVVKTIKQLAAQLDKSRRKQASRASKTILVAAKTSLAEESSNTFPMKGKPITTRRVALKK